MNLNKINQELDNLCVNNPTFSPITPADISLFEKFFKNETKHTYGNSWTYITQNMYGIGPHGLGYKYFDGKTLSAICIYPKMEDPLQNVFYWIRPLGGNSIETVIKVSNELLGTLQIPVSVTKLFKEEFVQYSNHGFVNSEKFQWHCTAPEEDDTLPEIITDIPATLLRTQKKK